MKPLRSNTPAIVTWRDAKQFEADAKAWNKAWRESNKKRVKLWARYEQAIDALRLLYTENADYIRLNHLGRVHHNVSMQRARAALKEYGRAIQTQSP